MTPDVKLLKQATHDPKVDPEKCMNGLSYRSVLGPVLYLSTYSRPDIAHAVNVIARHSTGIAPAHVKALLRVVKYLNGTQSWGIQFQRPEQDQENMKAVGYQSTAHPCDPEKNHLLRCYADSDYAGAHDRKSTTGYIIMLNGGPICWGSSKQRIVAQSTAEAEVTAATDAGKDVIHMRLLLSELGFPHHTEQPTTIFEDNQSCIYLARNLKSRRTARHYEIRLRFLQQMVQDKEIEFTHIGTAHQIADLLTKPLAEAQFINLRNQFMLDCS